MEFRRVLFRSVLNVIAETDFSLQTSTAAGGCFIATAAFGSAMARQVQCLRVFRDRTLLSAWAGRAFVRWYYQWSPRAAGWLRVHSMARKLTRAVLWVPVAFAWTSLRTNVVLASMGFVALLLVLGWSLRRGPAWWKVLCLLILALGMASAQAALLETVATPAANFLFLPPAPGSDARFKERPAHRPELGFTPEEEDNLNRACLRPSVRTGRDLDRSEEHTSELQSL